MRFPGFTAESALREKETSFQQAATAPPPAAGEVVPQFCYHIGQTTCCWWPFSGWVCHVLHTLQ
jgi:hypothetical protein